MKKKADTRKTKRESADNNAVKSAPKTKPVNGFALASKLPGKFSWLLLAFTTLLTLICRIRLLDVPLERDEGEYAYVGQQLLHGVPPFVSIYHVKLPGIYVAYALIEALFGQTCIGIHLGLLLVNLGAALALFFIIKKIYSPVIAAFSTAFFMLITLSMVFAGFTANAEHFVLLFALTGILALLHGFERQASGYKTKAALFFLLSGLLLGAGYLMKQHCMFFIFFAGLFFLYKFFMHKPLIWLQPIVNGFMFLAGIVIPLAVTCVIFLKLGLFDKFWWWTWQYPRIYISRVSWEGGLTYLKYCLLSRENYSGAIAVLWPTGILSLIGLAGAFFYQNTGQKVFVWGLSVFSLMAVSLGFMFYPHYFILSAPTIGLSAALGAQTISEFLSQLKLPVPAKYAGILAISAAFALAVYTQWDYLFEKDSLWIMRNGYGGNPFPEAVAIGEYIKAHSKPDDKIIVFGSEPEIYFYANRRAASGFVYTYELMKDHPFAHQFQTEMINEIKQNKPEYLLWIKFTSSWFTTPAHQQQDTIVKWGMQYASQYYRQIGIANIVWPGPLEEQICWDAPGNPCQINSSGFISINKRIDSI